MKWFAGINTIAELRTKYRQLLKKYHPDNPGGSVEITQEINKEYDKIFDLLNKKSTETGETQFTEEENQQFKEMLNSVINYNITLEIIGTWIWAFDSYEYRKELKELGFTYAPKKKAWTWHYGEYKRHHKKEISIDDIRAKYGTETVRAKSKQNTIAGC